MLVYMILDRITWVFDSERRRKSVRMLVFSSLVGQQNHFRARGQGVCLNASATNVGLLGYVQGVGYNLN
ncbi:Glycerol-3-phosphate dehydrogenase [NAD(+)] [Psidium guajava]|nr:Glycerol-3-phosphate dehydrogenase [NAD(+)] [Psidium guajava]